MPDAICNTSPLLYLYRIEAVNWLPRLFNEVWTLNAVARELQEGQHGCHTMYVNGYWLWPVKRNHRRRPGSGRGDRCLPPRQSSPSGRA